MNEKLADTIDKRRKIMYFDSEDMHFFENNPLYRKTRWLVKTADREKRLVSHIRKQFKITEEHRSKIHLPDPTVVT